MVELIKMPYFDMAYGTYGKILKIEDSDDSDEKNIKVRTANSWGSMWITRVPEKALVYVPPNILANSAYPYSKKGILIIISIDGLSPLGNYLNLNYAYLAEAFEEFKGKRDLQLSLAKREEDLAQTRGIDRYADVMKKLKSMEKTESRDPRKRGIIRG